MSIVDLSKTFLETSISFSTPHLQQNHVSPNVGSVHWLAPNSQRVINQQCDGEVSSLECAPVGRPSHGSHPPPSPLKIVVHALVVVVKEKVQVAPRGSNRKLLAFEELGNFLELDENHVVEGDVKGLALMEEIDANKEEANQTTKEHPILDLPNSSNQELEVSKHGKKVVKFVAKCVSTVKTTR